MVVTVLFTLEVLLVLSFSATWAAGLHDIYIVSAEQTSSPILELQSTIPSWLPMSYVLAFWYVFIFIQPERHKHLHPNPGFLALFSTSSSLLSNLLPAIPMTRLLFLQLQRVLEDCRDRLYHRHHARERTSNVSTELTHLTSTTGTHRMTQGNCIESR